MKDDASLVVTGILIQSENERQEREFRREQEHKSNALSAENLALQEQNQKAVKKNVALKEDYDDVLDDLQTLHIINRDLSEKNQQIYAKAVELRDELDNYKLLLREPMAAIAKKDGYFRETYERQMELIATWILSRKAFKELAIQLGAEKGLTADEVIAMGNAKKMDVLENRHDPEHGSNAEDVEVLSNRIELLKNKMAQQG